jgi:hypothetical protein
VTALELVEAGEVDDGDEDLSALPHPVLAAPMTTTAAAQPAMPIRSTSTHVPSTCHRYPASPRLPTPPVKHWCKPGLLRT